jgi:catechol 2,3-dioxygenase-like lactoylglutathione lyase family enzyme
MNLPLPHQAGGEKPQIVHLAIQADNAEQTVALYKGLFAFRELKRLQVRNLTAVHLYDGHTYLSVVQYHTYENDESRAVARTPCIHHMGLEVGDAQAYAAGLLEAGCTQVSEAGVLPIKFLTPERIMIEIAEFGYFWDLLMPME